jgi:hypothetical protein
MTGGWPGGRQQQRAWLGPEAQPSGGSVRRVYGYQSNCLCGFNGMMEGIAVQHLPYKGLVLRHAFSLSLLSSTKGWHHPRRLGAEEDKVYSLVTSAYPFGMHRTINENHHHHQTGILYTLQRTSPKLTLHYNHNSYKLQAKNEENIHVEV